MNFVLTISQRLIQVPREYQALAFLRVFAGLFFFYLGLAKFNNPHMVDVLKLSVRTWAEHHPQPVYQAFLETVVLPNAVFFTRVVTFSELFIGLSYILGAGIRYSSVLGLLLNMNFLLATQHMGVDALGINLAFLVMHVTLLWGQSGLHYGLDAFLSPVRGANKKKTLTSRHLKTGKNTKAKLHKALGQSSSAAKPRKEGRQREKVQREIRAALSQVETKSPTMPPESHPKPSSQFPKALAEEQSIISPKIRDLRD